MDLSCPRRKEAQKTQLCQNPRFLEMTQMTKWVNFWAHCVSVANVLENLINFYQTPNVTFHSSDISWRDSTERGYQEEDDETGGRNKIFVGFVKCHFSAICYFSGVCPFFFLPSFFSKTRLEMQKALEQDSTVYDYDAVYDDMQKQKLESSKKVLTGADKRVNSLMLNAVRCM